MERLRARVEGQAGGLEVVETAWLKDQQAEVERLRASLDNVTNFWTLSKKETTRLRAELAQATTLLDAGGWFQGLRDE